LAGGALGEAAGAAHGGAVEFINRAANEADLIVPAVGSGMGPGKFVAAENLEESRQQRGSGHVVVISCSYALIST
jgi:hypothetical protein